MPRHPQTTKHRPSKRREPSDWLSVEELELGVRHWILDAEIARKSPHTQLGRHRAGDHLLWFLRWKGWERCGELELREFFGYISTGHLQPGGRWGEADQEGRWGAGVTRSREPVKPSTVKWYHVQVGALMNFLVGQEKLSENPLRKITRPAVADDGVQPFTMPQVLALLAATKGTLTGDRDRAILLFLLDTGCRSSELLSLRVGDLDMRGRTCSVVGKGSKRRELHFTVDTEVALWPLVERRHETDALFPSYFGERVGQAMSHEALSYVFKRLGRDAGIKGVRCSPHTMRHTFAVSWLRNQGDVFSLQKILGHASIATTQVYVKLAQADIAAAYRTASPVANLLRPRR